MGRWFEAVPFSKIFVSVAAGVVAAHLVGDISLYILLPLVAITLAFIITQRKLLSILATFSLFLLGLMLPQLDSRENIPLSREFMAEVIIRETTAKEGIFIAEEIETSTPLVIIFDKQIELVAGDSARVTIICEPLPYSHFTVKRLTRDVKSSYSAVVTNTHQIAKGVNYKATKKPILKRYNELAEERLRSMDISPEDIEVINGMILGNREKISSETKELFSASSLSHIIAISGMHIGIIFMILNILLSPAQRSFRGRIVVSIIIIATLWIYTLFVGSPLSAIRATAMFSIMQIALLRCHSSTQIFNTLFAVATVMVLHDSNNLYDIGFQLSFTAVLSILIVMPILKRIVPIKGLFIDIILVTIAAQLLTIPIVLHYFGTLSLVSVICNIIGSVSVIIIAILSTIFIIIPNNLTEWLLGYLFEGLRYSLERITSLPYSHFKNINFDMVDMLFYIAIVATTLKILYTNTQRYDR